MPGVSFAIWSTRDAPDDEAVLAASLRQGGGATVDVCRSQQEWIRSSADVLILRGSVAAEPTPPSPQDSILEEELRALECRRVIGIGNAGGQLFGALGLDISEGNCADFRDRAPRINLCTGPTMPAHLAGSGLLAFDTARLQGAGELSWSIAMYLPTTSPLVAQVEALARWECAPKYAPLVRQGNMILWGIATDARMWTPELAVAFRTIAFRLVQQEARMSPLDEWDIRMQRRVELELAPARSAEAASDRTFYFRSPHPTVLTAQLEVEEGRVRVFFRGRSSARGVRLVDVGPGEKFWMIEPLTARHLVDNASRYWALDLSNLDDDNPARCTLHLACNANVEFRFPTGLVASLASPPSDTGDIADLIRLATGEDALLAAQASAVLVIVGDAAIPALRRANRALLQRDPLDAANARERLAVRVLLNRIRGR